MSRKQSLQLTRDKRKTQICRIFQLKVDISKLSKSSRKHLNSLFLEGKWLYNHILDTKQDIKDFDTKLKTVPVLVKEEYENRDLHYISSQMKQSIKDRMFQNILSLSAKKKQGSKVGKLKFISQLNSIPLKQYKTTYKILKNSNHVKIQGLKQKLKVNGLEQISAKADIANAMLIKRNENFYLHVTTYQKKVKKSIPKQSVGIDFGCATQLTLSNGVKINYQIPVNKRLKKLDRKIMKKNRKRSHNKFKDQLKRSKAYEHLTNQKTDIKNKVVSVLTNNYQTIVFQDESIKAWHSGSHGKKIQNTALGGIIRDLKDKSHTPIVVDKFFPSTQLCPSCHHKHKLSLAERTYVCPICSFTADRDVKAAQCILTEGLQQQTKLPTERRNVKPEETLTSVDTLFNSLKRIKNVSVSKVETLSLESRSQEAPTFRWR